MTTRLLPHLPQDLGHLARNLGGTAKDHGCVSGLENAGVLLDSHHGSEGFGGFAVSVLLDVDNVSGLDLLILGNTLDGEADGVTGQGLVKLLLVLFDGEDLLVPKSGGNNTNYITGHEGSLLDGTADNLTHSLNVVNVRDWKTDGKFGVTLGGSDEVVERVEDGESGDGLLWVDVGLPSLVPGSLVRLGDEVVAVEARVGDEGDLLGLEANELKHLHELILDFVETFLGPAAGVHLVDSDNDLVDTQEVEETGVLTGLALIDSKLGIGLGNGGLETTLLGGHEKHAHVGGGGSCDHVLNVILVAGGVYNGVVVFLGEELLGVALDGHTTLALLLTGVEVVSKAEGRLALFLGRGLQLVHLSLGDTSLLEDKVAAGGGLAGIDVSADDNGKMFLLAHGFQYLSGV